jgi:Leucine-rich repeat (LRR) protein
MYVMNLPQEAQLNGRYSMWKTNRKALDLSFACISNSQKSTNDFTNLNEIHLCGTNMCCSRLRCILLELNQNLLDTLHVGGNSALHDLPSQLSLFTSLSTLGLGACQIEVLPEWICRLNMLEEFYARDNRISTLPNEMWVRYFDEEKIYPTL